MPLFLPPSAFPGLSTKAIRSALSFLNRWEHYETTLKYLAVLEPLTMVSLIDAKVAALAGLEQYDEALAVAQTRIKQKATRTAEQTVARLLMQKGETDRALTLMQDVVARYESGQTYLLLMRGDTAFAAGDLDAAEAAFLDYHRRYPNGRAVLPRLARLFRQRGDLLTAGAYAIQAYTVNEGERELPINLLRELQGLLAELGETNRAADAGQQLAERYERELEVVREVIAGDEGPRERAKRSRERDRRASRAPAPAGPPPLPLPDLGEIPVSAAEKAEIEEAARELFAFPRLRSAQVEIIACTRRRENVLAILPTGAGKSLCYQLPAFMQPGLTLVVSPLIALMKDQIDGLPERVRAQAIAVNSSLTGGALQRAVDSIRQGHYRLVYAAPERLRQLPFIHALRQAGLALNGVEGIAKLVIDEAHCVSIWGHDFRPDYLGIAEAHKALGSPPILAMTATAPPRVRLDIERRLFPSPHPRPSTALRPSLDAPASVPLRTLDTSSSQHPERTLSGGEPIDSTQSKRKSKDAGPASPRDGFRYIALDTYRPNLRLSAIHAASEDEKRHLLVGLCHKLTGSGIIYARTRAKCEELADLLRQQGRNTVHYHAGISNRAGVQERFMRGEVDIIVATIAFGMGVDKADIRFIVHYGLPDSVESYYQEAGRAGRDGERSDCVLLFTNSDKATLTRHANNSVIKVEFLRQVYAAVRRGLQPGVPGRVVLDGLARTLGGDEITTRVSLSILEQAGLLVRHHDAPASVSLRPMPDQSDDEFEEFVETADLSPFGSSRRDFLGLAAAARIPATRLEARLLGWQAAGVLAYSPFGRAGLYTLPPAPGNAAQRIDSLLNQYAAIQQQRVAEIWDYARTARCRHGHLAAYLGGQPRTKCAACDTCSDEFDAYEAAQAAAAAQFPPETAQYAAILQTLTEGSWGHATLNALLRGDTSINPRAQQSSGFGQLNFRSKTRLQKMIDRLLRLDFVREKSLSHGGIALEITPEGRDALKDERMLAELAGTRGNS